MIRVGGLVASPLPNAWHGTSPQLQSVPERRRPIEYCFDVRHLKRVLQDYHFDQMRKEQEKSGNARQPVRSSPPCSWGKHCSATQTQLPSSDAGISMRIAGRGYAGAGFRLRDIAPACSGGRVRASRYPSHLLTKSLSRGYFGSRRQC